MSDREYELAEKMRIKRLCKENFGVDLRINTIVASDVEMTQDDSYTTIFNTNGAMYALCETNEPTTLRDIKSQIRLMGLDAEYYYPPAHDANYFERYGKNAFLSVFPGREIATESDIDFYKTLAPYSPALVRIRKVNGRIRRFNKPGNMWQTTMDLSYSRIRVQ